MPDSLALNVRSVLAERGSDPGDLVLKPIPGGASRETWLVEGDESRWVLRRDPEGSVSLVPIEDEFALITQAHEAGVPVPQPVLSEPRGGRFGSAGMLMAFVEGTSVAPRILRKPEFEQARARLTAQLGDALARIHSLPVSEVGALLPAVEGDPALAQIDEWERQLDEIGEPLPAVELGLRWLRANSPGPAEPRLVHGDFRLGNFIVDEDGLAAVIDWELAHLGDPAEDIGWLCIRSWRFGNDDRPVAGVGRSRRVRLGLRGRGRCDGRSRADSLLGGLRQRQVGGHLRPPGPRPPDRSAPQPRARLARPPDLRAGVGPAGVDAS